MTDLLPLIEESIDVAAPVAEVWALVSDLPRLAEWSPQVAKTLVRGGTVGLGARMINLNRRGLLVWPTQSKVVRFEPEKEVAFRVKENKMIWSFTLEPREYGGTRVIHRREAPDGTTDLSAKLVKKVFGGQPAFQEEMRQGMLQTLQGIKRAAE